MTTTAEIIANSGAAFGTSGVRGLVGELDDATCFAYVLAFLSHLKIGGRIRLRQSIHIGQDLRPSSQRIAQACASAVQYAGFIPVHYGEISTPSLAFAALGDNSPAIMITGSHIPFDRNGIKFYRHDGELMKEDETPVVNCDVEFPDHLFHTNALITPPPPPRLDSSAHNGWQDRYVNAFSGMLAGMRVGHYQHSAAGRDHLQRLLEELGAEIVVLARSETFVPIDTEAVSKADAEQAQQWVNEHRLDALISTDGDGDRPLLADDTGTFFRGDTLGILAARALGASTVVTPVSSNTALEKSNWFQSSKRTKIGSPHVIAAMTTAGETGNRRVVGFEANGGFLSATPLSSPWNDETIAALPTRDSVLPILSVFAIAKKQNLKLSELSALLPARFTASDRLENTPREKSLALVSLLKQDRQLSLTLTTSPQSVASINETDGLRMTFQNDDIVHLRPSGNAPELRIYAESNSPENAGSLLTHAKSLVQTLVSCL